MPEIYLRGQEGRIIPNVDQLHVAVATSDLGSISIKSRGRTFLGLSNDEDLSGGLYGGETRLFINTDSLPPGGKNYMTYVMQTHRRDTSTIRDDTLGQHDFTGTPWVIYQLTKGIVGDGHLEDVPDENRVRYEDMTPGSIIMSAWDGPGPLVSGNFSATHDSDGNAWADPTGTLHVYAMTETKLGVLDDLTAYGRIWWRTRATDFGYILEVFEPTAGPRHDYTGADGVVEIDAKSGTTLQAPRTRSREEAAVKCFVSGAPGTTVLVDQSASYPNAPDQYAVCPLSFPSTDDTDILEMAGRLEIARRMGQLVGGKGIMVEQTARIKLNAEGALVPGVDYAEQDLIIFKSGLPTSPEAMLVDSWVLHRTITDKGQIELSADLVLGRRLAFDEARFARRMAALERLVSLKPDE